MSDQQQQQDQSYRYGGQGFSGVPGGVALNAGSGGFGGDKYAQSGDQSGQQAEHTKPASHDDSYRYGGQGFSGVPGGVALNAGSGGFGGDKYAAQGNTQAGAQAEQPQQQEQSYRYGGQGFSGVPGGVALEAGAGHFGGHAASDGSSHHHSHHHGEGGAAAGGTIAPGTGHAHHKHEHHDHNEHRG